MQHEIKNNSPLYFLLDVKLFISWSTEKRWPSPQCINVSVFYLSEACNGLVVVVIVVIFDLFIIIFIKVIAVIHILHFLKASTKLPV